MMHGKNKLVKYFEVIKDEDEEILWSDSPVFIPFILKSVPYLIFGLLWGAMDFFLFMNGNIENAELTLFMLIHMMPMWLGIGNFIRLLLVFPNTHYALTNKRLLLRSGFWGIDFKSIDYDKISDIYVKVNPIEAIFKVGTIQANTGRTNIKGKTTTDDMISIPNPYEVFKNIKKTSVDVKTDWNYPNALRPDNNPGYKTKYGPE